MIEEKLEAIFAELGQRNSAPRKLLTEELTHLAASQEGFTAEDLWRRLKKSNATIGRATIFRAVKQLTEQHVLDAIDFSDGTRLYRACGDRIMGDAGHHHHLACDVCHRIFEFHYCLPEGELARVAEMQNFRVQGHSLTVYGACGPCQSTSKGAIP